MAIQGVGGFETGDIGEAQSAAGTYSIQGSVVRTGSYALRCNPVTTGTGSLKQRGWSSTTGASAGFSIATSYSRFYFRYAVKPASNEEVFFSVANTIGSPMLALRLNSAGNLVAYDTIGTLGTGASVLSSGTWYRIEVKCPASASGAWEIKIDGVSELSGSTGNFGVVNTGAIWFGKDSDLNGQSVDFYYDDWRIDDAAYPGIGECKILLPTSDGTYTAWTSDYTAVDEIPHNSDTDYVTSTQVTNDAESANVTDTGTAGITGAINAVRVYAALKRDGASNGAVRLRCRSGSTNSDTSSNYATTSTYAGISKLYATDPNTGAAWSLGGLDGIEAGVVEQSASQKSRCTLICVMVDYTPALPKAGLPVAAPRAAMVAATPIYQF